MSDSYGVLLIKKGLIRKMKIKGLELPAVLQKSLLDGAWTSRGKGYSGKWKDERLIEFFKRYFHRIKTPFPEFFDYGCMVRENALWTGPRDVLDFYIGEPNKDYPPGNVEPKKTVIIGSAEPDSPIALDYRSPIPKVIYFGDVEYKTIWVEAFSDLDEMITALEIYKRTG